MNPAILIGGASTEVTRQLCDSETAKIPAEGLVSGKKYQSKREDWTLEAKTGVGGSPKGFACLRFELNAPQYYSYSYTAVAFADPKAAAFSAIARGDLDGNGDYSTFTLKGAVEAARLKLAPQLIEVNPEE